MNTLTGQRPDDPGHGRPVPVSAGNRTVRVLVTGSRTWTDAATITAALDELHARHGQALVVVHGACPRGADTLAQAWARARGVPVEAHPADWSKGRGAGPARNAAMVSSRPDACLAFIRGDSRGATGCAAMSEHAGIPTTRHTCRDDDTDEL